MQHQAQMDSSVTFSEWIMCGFLLLHNKPPQFNGLKWLYLSQFQRLTRLSGKFFWWFHLDSLVCLQSGNSLAWVHLEAQPGYWVDMVSLPLHSLKFLPLYVDSTCALCSRETRPLTWWWLRHPQSTKSENCHCPLVKTDHWASPDSTSRGTTEEYEQEVWFIGACS